VERNWVLSLYDILTQLGYSVFMDQFVLVAGESLTSSLEDNLRASQAGILVWSARSEDSEWCKKEYRAFQTLHDKGSFRFVISRLQAADLPLFAQDSLWVDATDQRDGPRGTSLLRLLYGLHGKPLPPSAVLLAADIDETTKRALARLKGLTDARDAEAIRQLAQSSHLGWRSSTVLPCTAAQALISIGSPRMALELLDAVQAAFPQAIRPRQLRGLALARSGSWKEAKAVLGELYELGERDPETVGIYARTWMDAYEATGDRLMLRRSRDLYAEGFAKCRNDFYPGINAAAKSIFLNDLDAGIEFAKRVEALVGSQARSNDYWHTATVAEVQLIQRRFDVAASLYEQAIAMAPGHADDHRSSCKQARRLLKHLTATPEQVSRVLGVFPRVIHAEDAQLAVQALRGIGKRVVTFTGYSGTGYEDPAAVREAIAAELSRFDRTNTLVCAGATSEGIGMVYPLALKKGYGTAGIVSSQAQREGVRLSNEVEVICVVQDDTWGGRQSGGRLSPTSQAMVDTCDEMIGIGGGLIARDELEEARKKGKAVKFVPAEMNHRLAIEKAAKAGNEAPTDFRGEAHTLFQAPEQTEKKT